jgi:hypothetical protein
MLIADQPLNSNKNRKEICELLLEKFGISGKNEGTKTAIK